MIPKVMAKSGCDLPYKKKEARYFHQGFRKKTSQKRRSKKTNLETITILVSHSENSRIGKGENNLRETQGYLEKKFKQ